MNASYLENFKNVIRGDSIIPGSLYQFAEEVMAKLKPEVVVELGSDVGQLLGKINAPKKVGIEISEAAVAIAEKSYPKINFLAQNVLAPWDVPADLMIDSHLFHCLVFAEERQTYLKHLKANLKPGGRIIIECMGKPTEFTYQHLLLNECGQIWAETAQLDLHGSCLMNGRSFIPFRTYFTHLTEAEIKASGLTIHTLFYSPLSFEFNIMGETLTAPLVRLILG